MEGSVSHLITDRFHWGIIRDRIAEIIEMLGNTFNPMVDRLVEAMGKIQTPQTPTATPPPVPVRQEKISWRERVWWWARLRTTAFLCGGLVGMMIMMYHYAPTTVLTGTISAQAGTSQASAPTNESGLSGRGWVVVNKTGQTLKVIDARGNFVTSILAGHKQPFSAMKGPNLYYRFFGPDGEDKGVLSHVFANNDMTWHELVIQ